MKKPVSRDDLQRVLSRDKKARTVDADAHTHRVWRLACLRTAPAMARQLVEIHEAMDKRDEMTDSKLVNAIKRILSR